MSHHHHRSHVTSRRAALRGLVGCALVPSLGVAWAGDRASTSHDMYARPPVTCPSLTHAPGDWPSLFGHERVRPGPAPHAFFPGSFFPGSFFTDTVFDEQSGGHIDQISRVHRMYNRAPYRPVPERHQLMPHVRCPRVFLKTGGDSEDHALVRYMTFLHGAFLHGGVHPDRLRIAVLEVPRCCRATPKRRLHAVLCLYTGEDILVLDNLYDAVYSHTRVVSPSLLYSFNHHQSWHTETS